MSESSHDDDTNAPETPTTHGSSPPVETPGPSVPPPTLPESETERREWADATRPDADILATDDPDEQLIEEEESAAAAEVRAMGGPQISDADDPAMEPVYQAGGGEQDGFEAAEEDLIENATHGDGGGNPLRDAFSPEAESDRSTSLDGDPDDIDSTEVTFDPEAGPDDPAQGPGLDPDRGPRGQDSF
jgi:hypothetical protein